MEDKREVDMSLHKQHQQQFMDFQRSIMEQCQQQQLLIQKEMEQQSLSTNDGWSSTATKQPTVISSSRKAYKRLKVS